MAGIIKNVKYYIVYILKHGIYCQLQRCDMEMSKKSP